MVSEVFHFSPTLSLSIKKKTVAANKAAVTSQNDTPTQSLAFKSPPLAAKRGAAIGIEGKWAIHPSQIEHANTVFSPPAQEVEKAHRIIEELAKAAAEGKGAAQLDGRMIDAASEKMAENIINVNKLIQSKK